MHLDELIEFPRVPGNDRKGSSPKVRYLETLIGDLFPVTDHTDPKR